MPAKPKACPFCLSTRLKKEEEYCAESGWDEVAEKVAYEIELQGYHCDNNHFFAVTL